MLLELLSPSSINMEKLQTNHKQMDRWTYTWWHGLSMTKIQVRQSPSCLAWGDWMNSIMWFGYMESQADQAGWRFMVLQ